MGRMKLLWLMDIDCAFAPRHGESRTSFIIAKSRAVVHWGDVWLRPQCAMRVRLGKRCMRSQLRNSTNNPHSLECCACACLVSLSQCALRGIISVLTFAWAT
ncbi:hypothetical protein OH76DRAFT_1406999 [Lentinus brumalis]|uniref:Uncharacterized protein n=1 Tax=Lentinus brumalis TaxID=2498619 RepID=A0A371D1Q7_9APHY|nr:hypothetical protein OH76DRAFT_1406999 [Polyporus brumalis]